MRPALVWGCSRYPSRSRAAMSERTVADETLTPGASTTCWDPTGWAEAMYSVTTALRMAALRVSRSASPGGALSVLRSSTVGMGAHQGEEVRGRAPFPGAPSCLALHSTEC